VTQTTDITLLFPDEDTEKVGFSILGMIR